LGPAMLVLFLGSHYALLMFGSNYAQHGILLLRLLIIAAVPDAITNIYVSVLRVQKRLRFAALLTLGTASLDLTLTWILLPTLGIAGTGWSFLIAQGAGSLVAGGDAIRIYRQQRLVSRVQHVSDQVEMKEVSPPVEPGARSHTSYMKTRK